MKTMRLILGDRASGGVIAVLAAGFVLLQVFLSAFSCSSSIRLGDEGTICHGLGTASVDPGDRRSDGIDHGCPCATLCGMGSAFVAIAHAHDLGAAYSWRDGIDIRYAGDRLEGFAPRIAGLSPPARAPPAISR